MTKDTEKHCCKYFGRASITLTAVSSAFLLTCQKWIFEFLSISRLLHVLAVIVIFSGT
jgi:hypothetical protein